MNKKTAEIRITKPNANPKRGSVKKSKLNLLFLDVLLFLSFSGFLNVFDL
jgi:hypothetical protein